jgi:hypothetical protein
MPTWKQIPSFIILGMFVANVIFDFGWFETPYQKQQKIEQSQ